MKKVEVTPLSYHQDDWMWNLLVDDQGSHYIRVDIEDGAVSFDALIQLTPEEDREYHGLGWIFLQYFANKINYFHKDFHERMIQGDMREQASKAVL